MLEHLDHWLTGSDSSAEPGHGTEASSLRASGRLRPAGRVALGFDRRDPGDVDEFRPVGPRLDLLVCPEPVEIIGPGLLHHAPFGQERRPVVGPTIGVPDPVVQLVLESNRARRPALRPESCGPSPGIRAGSSRSRGMFNSRLGTRSIGVASLSGRSRKGKRAPVRRGGWRSSRASWSRPRGQAGTPSFTVPCRPSERSARRGATCRLPSGERPLLPTPRFTPDWGVLVSRYLLERSNTAQGVEALVSQEERQRSTEEAVDSFLDSVNRSGFWQSIDVRVCAVRDGRRWVSLVTRGFLDHRAPRSVPRFSPVHRPDLRAWQVVFPIADLNGVVRGIASGTAKLGPRSVTYIGRSSEAPTDIRYVFSELAAPYHTEYDHWSCHALVDHGASMWGVVRQAGHDPGVLDIMIRGGPNAYDGLSDLVGSSGKPGRM